MILHLNTIAMFKRNKEKLTLWAVVFVYSYFFGCLFYVLIHHLLNQ